MFKVGFSYFQGRFLLTDFYPWELTGMSLVGVYAATGVGMLLLGLGMDEVGVYCSWEMMGRPSIIPSTDVPGERSFSATRVLVVCSACQVLVFVNRRLSAGLPAGESLGAIGLSVIPGWTSQLYCCAQSLFSPPWYSLFPLFSTSGAPPSLCPVSPPHSPSSILLPSLPLFVFCPSHQ